MYSRRLTRQPGRLAGWLIAGGNDHLFKLSADTLSYCTQVIWTDTTTDSNLGSVTVVPTMAPGVSAATLTTAKLNAQVILILTLTLPLPLA